MKIECILDSGGNAFDVDMAIDMHVSRRMVNEPSITASVRMMRKEIEPILMRCLQCGQEEMWKHTDVLTVLIPTLTVVES